MCTHVYVCVSSLLEEFWRNRAWLHYLDKTIQKSTEYLLKEFLDVLCYSSPSVKGDRRECRNNLFLKVNGIREEL
jgi:hypothetical protein